VNISELFLTEFDSEMERTRKMLERVPLDDPDWKPRDKSMKIARLAGHVAEIPTWANDVIGLETLSVKPGYKSFVPADSRDLLAHFDGVVAKSRAAIAGAGDEDLLQPWSLVFEDRELFKMPRHQVLRGLVMNHLIHHRGQLSVYLRLRDTPVPGMYGRSADEN
jgi:uncharacterized damage-inducible protein DinB